MGRTSERSSNTTKIETMDLGQEAHDVGESERSSNTTKIETPIPDCNTFINDLSERSSNTTKIETSKCLDRSPYSRSQKEVLTQQRLKLLGVRAGGA